MRDPLERVAEDQIHTLPAPVDRGQDSTRPGPSAYPACGECGTVFASRAALRSHVRRTPTGEICMPPAMVGLVASREGVWAERMP